MSNRWFDSSRQIFWDTPHQDLTIPGSLNGTSGTFDTLYAPELYTTKQIVGSAIGSNLAAVPSISPGSNWISVAMSATGQYQSAAIYGGVIWISSNYGQTWVASGSPLLNTRRIAMSASGQYQTAVPINYYMYISSDYGNTWSPTNQAIGGPLYNGVRVSASGQYQTVVVNNNYIYQSSDYGTTWISRGSSQSWYDIAMSGSGQYQSAVATDGSIYQSSDYGVTWTPITIPSAVTTYTHIAFSVSAQYQAIINNGTDNIYISNDYGINWTAAATSLDWKQIAISASGQYMVAYEETNMYFWTSTDYGTTWNTNSSAIPTSISGMALSASADYFTTVISGDTIYTSTTPVILPNVQIGTATISSIIIPTIGLSSINTNFISSGIVTTGNFSTLTATISSAIITNLRGNSTIVSTLTGNALSFSSLVGNTLFTSSATVSTLTGNALSFSSLVGNTLFTSSATVSTLTGNALSMSSLRGNTFSASTATVSTLTGNALSMSSLVGNTFSASTATVSTLTGNALSMSSLRGNTFSASTATVSTLTGNALSMSSLVGNTLFVSTATVSTLNTSLGLFSNLTVANSFYSWQTTSLADALTTNLVSNFNLGSSNFTMECFFYPTANITTAWQSIMALGTTNTGGHEFRISQYTFGSGGFGMIWPNGSGTDGIYGSGSVLPLNTWHHLALVRSTNQALLFLNGTLLANSNIVYTTSENLRLFLYTNPYDTVFDIHGQGYLNSARVVVGQALYTGNFTPPLQQLTTSNVGAIGTNVAASLTGTVAFLGGTLSTLTDASSSGLALTIAGSPRSGTAVPSTFTGAIGINCNAPRFGLDVNGIINTNSFISNNLSSLTGQISSLITQNLSSVQVQTSSIRSINLSSLTAQIGGLLVSSLTGISFSTNQFLTSSIGINCNAPQYRLDVNGTIRAASINAVAATNVSSILYAGGFTTLANTATLSFQTQGGGGGTVEQRIQSRYDGTNYGISIDDVVNSKTDNLRITNGTIGINCNAPQSTLDVNGITRIGGPGVLAIGNTSTLSGAAGVLKLRSDYVTTDTYQIEYNNGVSTGTDTLAMRFVGNSDSGAQRYFSFGNYTSNIRSNAWNTSMAIGSQNGRVGINCNAPTVALDVAGNIRCVALTQTSDQRAKQNIVSADTSICYSTMQGIDLKYFQWNSTIQSTCKMMEKHQLGFIAQEIKQVFPNSVILTSSYGYTDFHSMETSQINAMHYGATKKLMDVVEQQGSTIQGIQKELSTLRG